MALLHDSRFRAFDLNGDPLVGASLTVYTANTTSLASVWRNSDLDDPMSNPTSLADLSGADGYFPQIFASEGALFDITLKDENGVTMETWLGVPGLGSGSAVIFRDFGSSRMQIADSGGVVRVEGGPGVGDNIGGQITIGGWAGSQSDEVILDGAVVRTTGPLNVAGSATVSGELILTGRKLPGLVTTWTTFTGLTTLDIALPNTPAGVGAYDLDITNLVGTVGNVALSFRFSFDDGVSYKSAGGYSPGGSTAFGAILTSAEFPVQIMSRVAVNAVAMRHSLFGTVIHSTGSGACASVMGQHFSDGTTGRITNVRIYAASGTLSGTYRVIPQLATGEV